MRKTLASLLLCSTLLAPACSKKASEVSVTSNEGGRAYTADRVAPTDKAEHRARSATSPTSMDASTVAMGSAAMPMNGQVVYNQPIGGAAKQTTDNNAFKDYGTNPWIDASKDNLSTFAADVDTASYTLARRMLNEHWSLVGIRDMAKRAAGDDKDRREMVSLIERTMQLTGDTVALHPTAR